MKPTEAKATLAQESRGMLEIVEVPLASDLVGLAVRVVPPPAEMIDAATGRARFVLRINQRGWQAMRADRRAL